MNDQNEKYKRLIPVESSWQLVIPFRRWIQNPQRLLARRIKEGMVVLEIGCGPGFFTPDIARMVGKTGKVIAADLQEGMLHKLSEKIEGTEVEGRISLHKCETNKTGISEKIDLVLAFSMMHEVVDKKQFLNEIKSTLNSNGRLYIIESFIHPPKKDFEDTIAKASEVGFEVVEKPRFFWSRATILKAAGK
jgi:ubiquinone/menaquinone biosynthesis C-methylase UbiE